jgi:hypothetical protein
MSDLPGHQWLSGKAATSPSLFNVRVIDGFDQKK